MSESPTAAGAKKPEVLDRAVGVQLVVIYKSVKAGLELGLALVLVVALLFGFAQHFHDITIQLRTHVTRAWAIKAAEWLNTFATISHLHLAGVALFLDGTLTAVEAWALRRGHWWGPWLVVLASGSLLPWEIVELIRYQRVGRLLVFLINLVIVVYLTFHALRHRRQHKE